MKKVYLASPFFKEDELEHYGKILKILRDKGLSVYAPLETELKKDGLTRKEWANKTFFKDIENIKEADVVVMLYFGFYSDSGTAWECGYAYGINKPVVAMHLYEGKSNCMVNCSCHANLVSLEELENYDFDKMPEISLYDREISG